MKNIFNPKVSIIIPIYNGANYMRDAIESALAQTYNNIEVIVINDGSNDDGETDKIAKSYGDKIRYFSKRNGGVATALNLGIEKMQGEYFSWLSHDDVYEKDKIKHQIEALRKENDKSIVVAGCFKIVDAGKELIHTVDAFDMFSQDQLKNGIFALLRGSIHGCCLLIPKSLLTSVAGFDETLITTQDYDCFFKIFKKKKILFLHTFDVLSRSHEAQGSKSMLDFHIKECTVLWKKMIDDVFDSEMVDFYNGRYNFLVSTKKFLQENTLYYDVIDYVDRKILLQLLSEKENHKLFKAHFKAYVKDNNLDNSVAEKLIKEISLIYTDNSVCFLLEDINDRGGLNRATMTIINGLAKYYPILLVSNTENDSVYELDDKVHCLCINNELLMRDADLFCKILILMNVCVVINGYNCLNIYLNLYISAKKYDLKTIAWNHEHYFCPYNKDFLWKSIIGRNIKLNKADYVIWMNKFSYGVYALFNKNGVYLPNPVCLASLCRHIHRSNRLIAVGRFDDERKGLSELLQVFSIVAKKNKVVSLHVFGQYDLDLQVPRISKAISYREYMEELKIPKDRLIFHGVVKDIEKYYQKSDFHILTSYNEGFGLVILEAASSGVPTVAFDGSAAEDIIDNGTNGYVINYGDIASMANKVLQLLDMDDEEYFSLSCGSLELAKKYCVENIIFKWRLMIDDLLLERKISVKDFEDVGMSFSYEYDEKMFKLVCSKYEKAIEMMLEEQMSYGMSCGKGYFEKTIEYYRKYGGRKTCKKIAGKLLRKYGLSKMF